MPRSDRSTFDAVALLDLAERSWAPRLGAFRHPQPGAAGAVREVGADSELAGAVAVALGAAYRSSGTAERREAALARRWPACVVIGLTTVACALADRDRFWPHWWAACRVRGTARDATAWGETFLAALRALELPVPDMVGHRRYVEAIWAYADGAAAEPARADEAGTDPGPAAAPTPLVTLAPFGPGIQILPPRQEGSTSPGTATSEATSASRDTAVPGEPRPATPDEVADPADPLLVFTEDGDLIPPASPLPARAVWAVFPADREPAADGPIRVIAEGRLPSAWNGWRLVQLALDEVRRLGLDGDGPRRAVRDRTRARIVGGSPVPGLTCPAGAAEAGETADAAGTAVGAAVLSEPPTVWVPGGADDGWRIEIRPAGGGRPVFAGTVMAAEDTEFTTLWDRLPRPLLGAFTISVHGPPGMGTRRTVVVAEGLRVRYEPSVRLLAPEGLAPAIATLSGPEGLGVTPATPVFPPTAREVRIACRTLRAELTFVLTPPHVRVLAEPGPALPAVERMGPDPGGWFGCPLRLATSTLQRTVALCVTVPGRPAPRVLQVVAGGRVVQEVTASGVPAAFPGTAATPDGQSGGAARFSVKRVLDTVTAYGEAGADLAVRVDGRPVPVAYVRPGGLATGAVRHGNRLVLSGAVWVPGLVAWVRPEGPPEGASDDGPEGGETAPLEVAEDCTITLPPDLTGTSRLWVRLGVRDPWLPGAPPDGQDQGGAFLVPP